MKKLVVLASGSGTNAESIVRYFEESDLATVVAIITNNKNAGVLDKARKLGVATIVLSNSEIEDGTLQEKLQKLHCDLVILAGFLRKIPSELIKNFEKRIINIHPALLPDYGGAGMYGSKVHQEVKENDDEVTGITIHYVNENYDEGEIIFQEEVDVDFEDSWQDVEYKVHELEYRHYPSVIEYLLLNL
jgi:phosphoribosylglycinamide formyltransferase-1